MMVIPAIDLKDGRCVRLKQGRMDQETRYSEDPVAVARQWAEAGARRVHLVDLNGAGTGRPVNGLVIREICRAIPEIPVQLGGGIRDEDTIQVIDTVETLRDMLQGMLDTYLSSISYRMNEVMKVLTIISTVFIPLTFIVGIYGMNFDYFPELHWWWAYPALWVIMIGIAAFMIAFFKRRKWI